MGYRGGGRGLIGGRESLRNRRRRNLRVGQARAFRDAFTLARRPQAHRSPASTDQTGG